jgi:hypothetical protein
MIEEDIYTALSGFAGLSALVSTRIYPLHMPQGATFPAVTYTRVSGARINNLDGENIQNPRYQVDCWAESYSAAKAVAAQVQLAFAAASFTSVLIADRDDRDDTAEIYRVSMDFSIWSV